MVETAINIIDPQKDILVCSSANSASIPNFNPQHPCICKLHGDFRYDTLQNTDKELQTLEKALCEYWRRSLMGRGLVIVGYSGNDNSIMNFLDENIDDPEFLSKGLFWTILKDSNVSQRVENLISKFKEKGKIAEIVEIEGFDDLLFETYKCSGLSNALIEEQWRIRMDARKPLVFMQSPMQSFIKLNAFPIVEFPKCNVFKTDITKWEQLRECMGDKKIIAALFKGCVYSFDCVEDLQKVFSSHIKSEILEEDVGKDILKKHNSIYVGMLYDLIEQHLRSKGLVRYAKNRYYLPDTQKNEKGLLVYEAVELAIEYVSPQLYLCLLPTVHVSKLNGEKLAKQDYQYQINQRTSTIYNKEYNEKLLARMRDVLGDAHVEEQRLLTEAAIFADKVAVNEETVRLASHYEEFFAILDADEPAGRKLDFLIQEINREVNTIGSKAFLNCFNLKEVYMPNGNTIISDDAFNAYVYNSIDGKEYILDKSLDIILDIRFSVSVYNAILLT